MPRSLILVVFVTKLLTRTRPNFLSSNQNLIKFRTNSSSKTPKVIGRMDPNDDLMCGDDGDVLEDTFGDEIDNFRPLPDGEFTIKSKKYNNFVLDLSENVDGGIIHSNEYNSGDNQTWLINYDSDKEGYILKSKQNPDLFLSWNSHDATKENNLRGFTNKDSKNHYWRIEQTDDGCYKFKNLDNLHMIITIQDIFSSFGGKQVTMDTEISSDKENYQKWILNPVYFQTIQDGNYNIFNRNLPDIVVGFRNQEDSFVHAQSYSVKENQEWKFSYDSEKEGYKIKCALNSDLLLTLNSNTASKEMVLGAYKDSGNKCQYWRIERTDDGSYRVRNLEHLNLILILNAASFDSQGGGLKLIVDKDSSDDANIHSRWTIKPVSYQSISDGDYNIFNSNLTDIVIEYSNREDSLVHGHSYRGNDSQTWTFVYNKEKKAYKIKNALSTDLLLCWDSNATSEEMFLRAYSESSGKNQYWRIEKVNDGSYRLRDLENTEKLITMIDKDSAQGGKELIVTDSKESGNDKITISSSWFLQKIGKPAIPNGKFKIATKSNYRKVINSNQESKLIIIDNLNLVTSDWEIKYDSTKRAYTIHSSKFENLGWVYQNKNCFVTLDNIDGSNLRNYWMVEYKMQAGGYLIRSLCDPSQAVSYSGNNLITTDATYSDNQLFNFIRN
ncbi:pierisin-like isoform X1 [Pieris napi]|uniref:pierisin-like isoform X1 n=1 Tax=Pieris napi TaxID=78633 RepID=UPI001FB8D085|nr:pierisin-like isoform X1 [Pieris napi]XP_047506639.1 pierisin-like isoform X1 [Pieris napi]